MCKAPPKCHFLEAFCNKFNPYQSPSCWPPWGSILSHLIIASRYPMLVGLLPRWHSGKESACQCRRPKRCEFNPWVGKIPGGGYGNSLQYVAWRISWAEEPGGLKSIDSVRQDWSYLACTHFSHLLDVEEIKNHLTYEKFIFNETWVVYRLKHF